jgi:hypothetical protein
MKKSFTILSPLKIPRNSLQYFARELWFALDEANLTEATDDPDEREDDKLLWVVGEVHAEPSPEKRRPMRMSLCATLHCKKG